jgi:hypothetical protein
LGIGWEKPLSCWKNPFVSDCVLYDVGTVANQSEILWEIRCWQNRKVRLYRSTLKSHVLRFHLDSAFVVDALKRSFQQPLCVLRNDRHGTGLRRATTGGRRMGRHKWRSLFQTPMKKLIKPNFIKTFYGSEHTTRRNAHLGEEAMKINVEVDKNTDVAFVDICAPANQVRIDVVSVSEALELATPVFARLDENGVLLGLLIENYSEFRREVMRKYVALRVEGIIELLISKVKSVFADRKTEGRSLQPC